MSFSDRRFSYGPFPPHWVPQQYIANYFSEHRTDKLLVLNTTVEDLSKVSSTRDKDGWRLVLRRYDAVKNVDVWWEEEFDAVIIANGHYSVPFVSNSFAVMRSIFTLFDRIFKRFHRSKGWKIISYDIPGVSSTPRYTATHRDGRIKRCWSLETRLRATM